MHGEAHGGTERLGEARGRMTESGVWVRQAALKSSAPHLHDDRQQSGFTNFTTTLRTGRKGRRRWLGTAAHRWADRGHSRRRPSAAAA